MDSNTHWHLAERPFEATWDTRFFYGSPIHNEALSRLTYHAHERGMNACMLSGDVGCGKTITRAVFAGSLDPLHYMVVALDNSGFAFDDLLTAILKQLDPSSMAPPATSRYERCERLEAIADHCHSQGRHLVIILDEAQDMSPSTLNDLRMLTNFNRENRVCLTLVLVGQPELRAAIEATPALNQRIALRYHLRMLTPADIGGYIRHRLRAAGHPTGDLFTLEACQALHIASRGVPRDINRFAKLAMELAWVRGHKQIDHTAVQTVIRDFIRQQEPFIPTPLYHQAAA